MIVTENFKEALLERGHRKASLQMQLHGTQHVRVGPRTAVANLVAFFRSAGEFVY